VMTRKPLDIQQPTGEVERQIDRANGAPAVEAAMRSDNGTKEIGHSGYATTRGRMVLARFRWFCQLLLRIVPVRTGERGGDVQFSADGLASIDPD
jgi:hypothetical protein